VVISLADPATIHAILGLSSVQNLRIPPGITPPTIPLQQASMFRKWNFCDAVLVSYPDLGRRLMPVLDGIAYSVQAKLYA